jgi:hypothetical protein
LTAAACALNAHSTKANPITLTVSFFIVSPPEKLKLLKCICTLDSLAVCTPPRLFKRVRHVFAFLRNYSPKLFKKASIKRNWAPAR